MEGLYGSSGIFVFLRSGITSRVDLGFVGCAELPGLRGLLRECIWLRKYGACNH